MAGAPVLPSSNRKIRPCLTLRPSAPGLVVLAIGTATLAKLVFAATTTGTNDVAYWTDFARGVDRFGPIGVYSTSFSQQYNHGPLAGWLLFAVNQLKDVGLGLPFVIRVPSSLADAVSSWLVFRLLSERSSATVAAAAAAGMVWSPALVVISGFHGNTDSVFVALTIASFWFLRRRDWPVLAGLCLGLAVSLKLVPVVAIPWLLFLAWQRGPALLGRFLLGGGIVFVTLWLPVVLADWPAFRDNVLSYQGIWLRQWGIAEFVEWAGYPQAELWLAEHGSYVAPIAAAMPFIVLLTGRIHYEVEGLGMSLVSLLLLTPAFGMQYLAWALAAAYLVSTRAGWVFNLAASVFVASVYSHWNGGAPPWLWDKALAVPFSLGQLTQMSLAWAALLLAWVDGVAPNRDNPAKRACNADEGKLS